MRVQCARAFCGLFNRIRRRFLWQKRLVNCVNSFRLWTNAWSTLGGLFDVPAKTSRIAQLEHQMSIPTFWDDADGAKQVIAELNQIKGVTEHFGEMRTRMDDLVLTLELAQEEDDGELFKEANRKADEFKLALDEFELELLLDGPYDHNNAIFELHPGAGGTESQDWAAILLRMYTRWAEGRGYKVETLDYQPGDEAGVKSVTLMIKGYNAYGYLKADKGVHRLVRISPFDSSGRRHTSFASVDVMPELDDSVEIDIRTDEIKVDTYRSTGAGGQHVNTTDSAVRITHLPTGVVVTCQSERSQIQNRAVAMKILAARLYERKREEQESALAAIRGEQKDIAWGSQIRSYVFHPYSMVKDHRTGYEVGNAQGVVDGDLDGFVNAYLRWQLHRRSSQTDAEEGNL
ncbi:peptide chain release factor 2 [Ferroacidibacillus organovorans]|uniref:Peptide chain release factor 2 n=1 Tax=Ferroacidibacillus organovorans TaxID=1765683 RepID=A0A1V4EVN5_9BACL|nr:peptide chain release factor 2 [Ferroacidibacillus organovorans]